MSRSVFGFISVLLLISIVYYHSCNSSTVRQTRNGPIEGLEEISVLGKKYYSFRRVPYAEIPITGNDPHTGAEVDRRFKVKIYNVPTNFSLAEYIYYRLIF